MIDRALSLVASRLNQQLRTRFDITDDLVALTGLTDSEGKPAAGARNRLAVFVTNIAEEPAARGIAGRTGVVAGRMGINPGPVYLNVYLMLASNFDSENYAESLKVLAQAIQFFQATPVFDHSNAPEMDRRIEQLTMEINNLDPDTASQLWGTHGGRYVPSIHYKMRMIAIQSGDTTREEFVIRRPQAEPSPAAAS